MLGLSKLCRLQIRFHGREEPKALRLVSCKKPAEYSRYAGQVSLTVNSNKARSPMAMIVTKDGTEIYYKDWGKGQPIVFSHGWPLAADAWDNQAFLVASHGYRAVAHHRR